MKYGKSIISNKKFTTIPNDYSLNFDLNSIIKETDQAKEFKKIQGI